MSNTDLTVVGLQPGVHDVPALVYHSDPTATPSLSASIVKVLINQSPAHARIAHPRLNPDFKREDDPKFELGTIVHSIFLEGVDTMVICPFADWRTAAAKETRDDARANGRNAVLAHQADEVHAMVDAVRRQCDDHPDGPFFTDGKPEQTIVWVDEYGVQCRALIDWLRDDHTAIHDLKTTKASASPYAWDRTAFSMSADIQAAWYVRGCERALGVTPEFFFAAAECSPPYAVSIFGLTPEGYELATKKIEFALKLWAKCLRNDAWPSYPSRVAYLEPPGWHEAAWLEKEVRES